MLPSPQLNSSYHDSRIKKGSLTRRFMAKNCKQASVENRSTSKADKRIAIMRLDNSVIQSSIQDHIFKKQQAIISHSSQIQHTQKDEEFFSQFNSQMERTIRSPAEPAGDKRNLIKSSQNARGQGMAGSINYQFLQAKTPGNGSITSMDKAGAKPKTGHKNFRYSLTKGENQKYQELNSPGLRKSQQNYARVKMKTLNMTKDNQMIHHTAGTQEGYGLDPPLADTFYNHEFDVDRMKTELCEGSIGQQPKPFSDFSSVLSREKRPVRPQTLIHEEMSMITYNSKKSRREGPVHKSVHLTKDKLKLLDKQPYTQALLSQLESRHSMMDMIHTLKKKGEFAKQRDKLNNVDRTQRVQAYKHCSLEIDPISELTQPYNLKVKQQQISKLVSKAQDVKNDYIRAFLNRPSQKHRMLKSIDYDSDLPQLQTAKQNTTFSVGRTSPKAGMKNIAFAPQSFSLRRSKMKNLDKDEEYTSLDPHKYIIKETPRTVINKLDASIEEREKQFKVQMVTQCILNGLDFDSFMASADAYIGRKMGELETKGIKFESNTINCGVDKFQPGQPAASANQCKHNKVTKHQSKENFLKTYTQMHKFHKQLQTLNMCMSKKQIVAMLKQSMRAELLSEEEQKVFASFDHLEQALFDPLRFMIKHDSQQALLESMKVLPVQTDEYDNSNKKKYRYEKEVYTMDPIFCSMDSQKHPGQGTFPLQITKKANDYLECIANMDVESCRVPKAKQLVVKPKQVSDQSKRSIYLNLFEQIRSELVAAQSNQRMELCLYDSQFISDRLAFLVKYKEGVDQRKLFLKMNTFLVELKSHYDRFEKGYCRGKIDFDYIDYDLEHQLNTRKKLPSNFTISMAQRTPQHTTPRSPNSLFVSPRRSARPNVFADLVNDDSKIGRLSQAQEDIIISQEIGKLMFEEQAQKLAFFQFIKTSCNGVTKVPEHHSYQKIFDVFRQEKSVPNSIASKIQNNMLRVEDTKISPEEAKGLGIYIMCNSQIITQNLRVVCLNNCKLKDSSLACILLGVEAQNRLQELHLHEEEVAKQSLPILVRLLRRPIPNTLQVLSLVGIKTPTSQMTSFFSDLAAKGTYLSKFRFSDYSLQDKPLCVTEMCKFLAKAMASLEMNPNQQVITHLWLENLSLKLSNLCEVMETLWDCKTIQFFSLAGNKLTAGEHSADMLELFENQINHFVLSNRGRLTHLDISHMYTPSISGFQKITFLTQLLTNIMEASKSLQAVHLDGWQLSEEQQFILAQQMCILEWPCANAHFAETFENNFEKQAKKMLSKTEVNHLIEGTLDFNDTNQLMASQIRKTVHHRCSSIDLIKQGSSLCLKRDLTQSVFDIQYAPVPTVASLMRPFIDNLESSSRWQLSEECSICSNYQNVKLFYSPEDPSFKRIQNPKVIELLKTQLPKTNMQWPILMGSMVSTNNKCYEMIPTQVWLLNLIREALFIIDRSSNDLLAKDSFQFYVQQIINKQVQWHQIVEQMPDCMTVLKDLLSDYHYESSRNSNFFNWPQDHFKQSFFVQVKAKQGAHSVIIYEASKDAFFCKSIVVDVRLDQKDITPTVTEFNQRLCVHNSNLFAFEQVQRLKWTAYSFLSDFQPEGLGPHIPLVQKERLVWIRDNYTKLNDLFLHVLAKSNDFPFANSSDFPFSLGMDAPVSRELFLQSLLYLKKTPKVQEVNTNVELDQLTQVYISSNLHVFQALMSDSLLYINTIAEYVNQPIQDITLLRCQVGFKGGLINDFQQLPDTRNKYGQDGSITGQVPRTRVNQVTLLEFILILVLYTRHFGGEDIGEGDPKRFTWKHLHSRLACHPDFASLEPLSDETVEAISSQKVLGVKERPNYLELNYPENYSVVGGFQSYFYRIQTN